jgi:desulfoferrodoxin-like iron-binding protein
MAGLLKCGSCRRIVNVVYEGKGELICCGQPMKPLTGFKSVEEILDFAVEKEEEAYRFYTEWAKKLDKSQAREHFEDFAREELTHKDKLLQVKQGRTLRPSPEKIADLKIADYLADVAPTPQMNYQRALIIAMQREKASFNLYNHLAGIADDEGLRSTFLALAQEEAKHKLGLETIYDEVILSEN